MKQMKTKVKAQVKSRFYYFFWGTATVAVVLGQLYVGTGYRVLAQEMMTFIGKGDGVLLHSSPNAPRLYWWDCIKLIRII